MTKKYLALVFLGVLPSLISCQTTKVTEQKLAQPRLPSAAEEEARSSSPGPIDDCLNFNVLYARNEGLTAECTLNYTHYFSERVTPVSKANIRIGTFNLFHMGDNQSSLKNFKVVAKIMNQWDIVGSQELLPLPGPQAY